MIGRIEKAEGLLDGTFRIALLTKEKPDLTALMDKDVEFTVKERKRHRSLDANGYYWVLLSKLAEHMKVSKPFCHNFLLGRYGQTELFGGEPVFVMIPETEDAAKKVQEDTYVHLRATAHTKEGRGGLYRGYQMLRGSSTYNTDEMSKLIDGLIDECRECGIPTETPEEIARMKVLFKERYEQRNKDKGV